MMEMSREMMKAGIIEEMLEDTMETVTESEEVEEAQEQIDKILFELTTGKLGAAPSVVKETLPSPASASREKEEESEEEDMEEMKTRLEALRSWLINIKMIA